MLFFDLLTIIKYTKKFAKSIINFENSIISRNLRKGRRPNPGVQKENGMTPQRKNMVHWIGQTVKYLVIAMILFLSPGLSFSGEDLIKDLDALRASPKLINPQSLLSAFSDGASTIRVIINLKAPDRRTPLNLRKAQSRTRLANDVRTAQNRVMGRMNAQAVAVTNRFKYVYGFSAKVTLKGLQDLVADGDVLSVEKDSLVYPNLAQGIPLMNATSPRSTYGGSGVSVAICDTGIDYTHSRLGGGGFPNLKVIGGYDCGDDDNDPMDHQGHGTACAGIVAGDLGTVGDYIGGVAPNARLYAVKISYGSEGSAWTSDMIEGWEWCVTHQDDDPDNPIMIISTSFGGGRYYSACDSHSPSMTAAAANAVSVGITLFASSGNDGYCNSMGWPACISHVISVGAVYDAGYTGASIGWCVNSGSCASKISGGCTSGWYSPQIPERDRVTVYSNTASFLGLLAPSNRAVTTALGGGYYTTTNGFGGTSAACPYAAGAAAVLQSATKSLTGSFLSPSQVESKLVESGDSVTDEKVAITKPRVNLGAAVALLASCPPCPSNGVIADATYPVGIPCSCSNAVAITVGSNVSIPIGAIVTYTAPVVNLEPGFHAENGADITIRQP